MQVKSVYRDVSRDANAAVHRDVRTDAQDLMQRQAEAAKQLLPELKAQVLELSSMCCVVLTFTPCLPEVAGRLIPRF